jgi:tetratricopeptide (TPR) repeat protein
MKQQFYTAAALLLTLTGLAQTLQDALTKTDNERFELAAADFRALIAKEPTKGDNYFYYGENFFKDEDLDSANIYYKKGAEINATNPLNYVGLGKVLLAKGNVNDAKTQFYKAASLGANKNAEVMRRTAEAWLVTDTKNADEAIAQANLAIKADPKNAENYILLGDAQLEKNPTDGSAPIKSYQTASTLNSKSPKGILREGKLYQRGRNYQLALDYYKKAMALDPNYAPAYREIAELYYLAGQPSKSIENWKKYLELNNKNDARYRFMNALYKNQQYTEAVTQYESLSKAGFKKVIMERLGAYSYYEMGDKTDKDAYTKGLSAINKFFELAGPDYTYLAQDYKYKGLLLARTGQDSLGVMAIEKAIAMDPTICGDAYSKLAKMNMDAKKYDKVIMYAEKKKTCATKTFNNNDYFDLGKAYYFTANNKQKEVTEMKADLTKKKKSANTPEIKQKETDIINMYMRSDSAFKSLTELNPAWPVGYTWRGRVNSILDPKVEKDSTKVFYEKVIANVKPEEKTTSYKTNVLEALEYLGYYYVTKKDKANADATFTMIRELDPNNEKQKNYFAPPKPAPAAPKPGGK